MPALAAEAGKPAAIDFIEVTGDVENAFTASVADFEQKAPMRKIMGCTCFGNPTDGRASANADVAGFRPFGPDRRGGSRRRCEHHHVHLA